MKNTFKFFWFIIVIALLVVAAVVFAVQKLAPDKDNNVSTEKEDSTLEAEVTEEKVDWTEIFKEDKIKNYKYDFELSLNVDNMTMDGILDFTYYNNNEIPMDELVFYLYANSYEKEEYHAIEEKYFDYGYPNDFSPGSIDIKRVDIAGGGTYEVMGSQNHLLVVKLGSQVSPNKSTQLKIEYTVTIPNSYGRFGYGNETISIVNCNPIMAVYDAETGYYDYDYNNIGDPFFSECADYSAKVTVQKDYVVVPTGTIEDKIYEKDTVTYVIDGANRRDFAFVASDEFEIVSEQVNSILVSSYSFSGGSINDKALQSAVDAIEVFSEKFGDYPYKTFNVVEANFFIGGMEYPGMVMIDDSYYTSFYDEIMEMIIVHEVAHQWWYAQVGNDQIVEPWLDEALASFSERVYYEHVYPDKYEDMIFNYIDSYYIRNNKEMDKADTRIDMNTLEYGEEYSLVVYGFGGWMIDDLREELGEEAFYEALSIYVEDNQFQIASREHLEKAIEEVTGQDITAWFDENLQVQVGY